MLLPVDVGGVDVDAGEPGVVRGRLGIQERQSRSGRIGANTNARSERQRWAGRTSTYSSISVRRVEGMIRRERSARGVPLWFDSDCSKEVHTAGECAGWELPETGDSTGTPAELSPSLRAVATARTGVRIGSRECRYHSATMASRTDWAFSYSLLSRRGHRSAIFRAAGDPEAGRVLEGPIGMDDVRWSRRPLPSRQEGATAGSVRSRTDSSPAWKMPENVSVISCSVAGSSGVKSACHTIRDPVSASSTAIRDW